MVENLDNRPQGKKNVSKKIINNCQFLQKSSNFSLEMVNDSNNNVREHPYLGIINALVLFSLFIMYNQIDRKMLRAQRLTLK